ncbi:hypothetical protein C0J52_26322 [Blattella germanica]|nr:hypothetical protein C0J52_26322 [Blattella germanica]
MSLVDCGWSRSPKGFMILSHSRTVHTDLCDTYYEGESQLLWTHSHEGLTGVSRVVTGNMDHW